MQQSKKSSATKKSSANGKSRANHNLAQRNVETIAKIEEASHQSRTVGERVADGFATTVGSWKFIIGQSVLLGFWVCLNVVAWFRHWDPYPFILLNLALSFQAAYASPIIMMSQNRQARVNDRRNRLDLQVNLLSEQENTEMLRLLTKIAKRLGVEPDGPEAKALSDATDPERLVGMLKEEEEAEGNG